MFKCKVGNAQSYNAFNPICLVQGSLRGRYAMRVSIPHGTKSLLSMWSYQSIVEPRSSDVHLLSLTSEYSRVLNDWVRGKLSWTILLMLWLWLISNRCTYLEIFSRHWLHTGNVTVSPLRTCWSNEGAWPWTTPSFSPTCTFFTATKDVCINCAKLCRCWCRDECSQLWVKMSVQDLVVIVAEMAEPHLSFRVFSQEVELTVVLSKHRIGPLLLFCCILHLRVLCTLIW